MSRFLVIRLGQSALLILVFLTLSYFLLQLQPGDITSQYVTDPNFTAKDRALIAASLGLDKPLWQQYLIYLGNFFRGEFGVSFLLNRPVEDIIFERLPRTLMLFLTATVIAFYLGFTLGKLLALRRRGPLDIVATIGGVYTFTIYTPWLALMTIWLFAVQFEWFPLQKFITIALWRNSPIGSAEVFRYMILVGALVSLAGFVVWIVAHRRRWRHAGLAVLGTMVLATGVAVLGLLGGGILQYVWDIISHMVLPILVLTVISAAGTMLLTRNSMLETVKEDYVLVARAKGLDEKVIRDRYVARNAILPVVTSLVISLAAVIDGGIITETVFTWPGLGLTLVESAQGGDIPLAVATFLFVGMFALVAHIVADILYVVLDPRIRIQ